MPPTNPGRLTDATYLNITAFILQYNGSRPGNQALTATTNVAIRTVATGVLAQAQAGGGGRGQGKQAAGAGAAKGGGRGAAAPGCPRGLTIEGTVKNYTPLTDAMMKNPDPNDWLMLRHDYHANNYSTLNQINTLEREGSATAMGMVDGGRDQSSRSGGSQRDDVHQQSDQYRAGAGRQDGRADLGEPHRRERDRQFAARPRDLQRQGLRHHRRRAYLRAGRTHRKERVGHGDRRSHQRELQHFERSAAGQGNGDPGSRRRAVRSVSRREMLHQRL